LDLLIDILRITGKIRLKGEKMENEIIEYKAGELASQKVRFEKSGLVIEGGTTFDEWEKIGSFLKDTSQAIQWWIGDWILYGEYNYGEMYSQALEETGYDYNYLKHIKSVSEKFELCRRRHQLSWSHHQEVEYLSPEKQDYWLDYAESNKLSKWNLRAAIRAAAIKEEGSNYDNLIDFIDHMKAYANEILQLADALHDKRIYVSPNQKQIILDQASLIHGLWDNLEYELKKGI
jgi:hypothetical protein